MRYSIKPREYMEKAMDFYHLPKTLIKNLSNKYNEKLLGHINRCNRSNKNWIKKSHSKNCISN